MEEKTFLKVTKSRKKDGRAKGRQIARKKKRHKIKERNKGRESTKMMK